tara:strand:+ start:709 stop:1260 length:552 start_codon:yes stop_codon:yes gene_type:complete
MKDKVFIKVEKRGGGVAYYKEPLSGSTTDISKAHLYDIEDAKERVFGNPYCSIVEQLTTCGPEGYLQRTDMMPCSHIEKDCCETEAPKEDCCEADFPKEDEFGPIFESLNILMDYKNDKYGNSALEPLEIFGGKSKVGTRLDDKLARVKNGETLRKNDVADIIGYLILVCKENNWENFDEFKD